MVNVDSKDYESIIDPSWGEQIGDVAREVAETIVGATIENYEPEVSTGAFERVGEIAGELAEGLVGWIGNITNRISRYFNNTWEQFSDDISGVTKNIWEALVSMIVPLPPDGIRDLPRYAIDIGLMILADKFKKSVTFKVISTTLNFLTGGWLKAALKPLFKPLQQFLIERALQFLTDLGAKWAKFNWPAKKKALHALVTGLFKGLKGGLTLAASGLKSKVLGTFSAVMAKISIKLIATIVGAAAGLAILAFVGTMVYHFIQNAIAPIFFAQGGFPTTGQTFIAREAGPELVGTIDSRNAVVNNDQIVESVSSGVYGAFMSALCGKNAATTVRANLYLDGKLMAVSG